jgi:hypothetical protein
MNARTCALTALAALGACDAAPDARPALDAEVSADATTTLDFATPNDATVARDAEPRADAAPPPDAALPPNDAPAPREDWTRDILDVDLTLALDTLEATAVVTLAPSDSGGASFEVGDLDVQSVEDADGPLRFRQSGGWRMDVGTRSGAAGARLTVRYRFVAQPGGAYAGWMPDYGVTYLWPYYCGHLSPCHSDPSNGQTYTLRVSGWPDALTAIFPERIPTDAPSYVPAVAVGEYTRSELGVTQAGTRVSTWHLPGQEDATRTGTAQLAQVFDFLERTYGAYAFGDAVGSVSVDWRDDPYSGLEHHPFWHIGREDMGNAEVHAHEAAHGWFGDGVRIACWEDFVLSEGTTTYISARALASAGVDVWPEFDCYLRYDCDPANGVNTVALPSTCGEIDIGTHPLWSTVPYMKGAYFYRAVAELLGVEAVDAVIARFYADHVGQAARMDAMLDALKAAAGDRAGEITALEGAWLRTYDCPVDWEALCPMQ